MELPDKVVTTIVKSFPETGKAWVDAYPNYLASLLAKWQLTIEGRASTGWPTNVVYFVRTAAGEKRVLKLGHPHPESTTEQLYLTNGAKLELPLVKLLDADPDGYAMLMVQIGTGECLRPEIGNPTAIQEALQLHLCLPREPVDGLPTYLGWMQKAFAEYRAQSSDAEFLSFIENAEQLYSNYAENEIFLLHGDLHHENILRSSTGWIAIDPKGVNGPRVFEVGRFFHNFLSDEISGEVTPEAIEQVLQRRFEQGADALGYSERLIMEVTMIDLTLAMTWHLNSGSEGGDGLSILRVLAKMLA